MQFVFRTAESEGISKTEAHPRLSQQGTADPKEAIRQAAISKGLDPNNPDVIKILEVKILFDVLLFWFLFRHKMTGILCISALC